MRDRRKRYTPGFKQQAVDRYQTSGKKLCEVAAELEIPEQTLANWVYKAEGHTPVTKLQETPEEELERLRKENVRLRQERDFLKKATAFFAKEGLK